MLSLQLFGFYPTQPPPCIYILMARLFGCCCCYCSFLFFEFKSCLRIPDFFLSLLQTTNELWNKFTFKVAITSVKFTFYQQSFHYCRFALQLHSSLCVSKKSLRSENTISYKLLSFFAAWKNDEEDENKWKSKEFDSEVISTCWIYELAVLTHNSVTCLEIIELK